MKTEADPRRLLKASVAIAAYMAPSASATVPSTIRYCNRGYCYTKREREHHHGLDHDILDPSARIEVNRKDVPHKKRTGLDFCTDTHGNVMDCELFSILGMDQDEIEAEFEALESVGAGSMKDDGAKEKQKKADGSAEAQEEGVIELDGHFDSPRISGHVTWKDRPVKGKCVDNDSGYTFECNLVQILDDGLVVIEDQRQGGVFAAQPKSGYTTRRSKSNMEEIRTPEVLNGSGPWDTDPTEDFRTNVFLNLEGI